MMERTILCRRAFSGVLLALAASPVAAQGIKSELVGGMAVVAMQSAGSATPHELFFASLDGRLDFERFALVGGYGEGRLGGASASSLFVEGYASLSARLSRGLELRFGPLVRATRSGADSERVLHWQTVVRYEEALGERGLVAFAEWWGAVSRHSALRGRSGTARGGSAGVGWRGDFFNARLSYALDEVRLPESRRQSVERITIRLGVSR